MVIKKCCIYLCRVKSAAVAVMKAKLTGANKVKLGERLQADILVSIQDQYGNNIQKVIFFYDHFEYLLWCRRFGRSSSLLIFNLSSK